MDPEETPVDETVDDAPPDAAAAEPGAAPATPWAPDQTEYGQLVQAVQALSQYAPVLGQLGQMMQAPEEPDVPELDPFDPDSVDQHVQARIEAALGEKLGRYEQFMQQQAAEVGQRIVRERLDAFAGEIGEFNRDQAELLARGFMAIPGADPNRALLLAAQKQHEFETELRKQAVEEHMKALKNIGDAPAEPGAAGAAGEIVELPTGADWGREFARRMASRP